MTIYLSLLVAIVGLLVHAFSANTKVGQAGLAAWTAGLTAFLITFAAKMVHL